MGLIQRFERVLILGIVLPLALLFFGVGAFFETIYMTAKGYRYNSGWGRWEK